MIDFIDDLGELLAYLETTSLEPHDDYTSEFTYKEQKILYEYITKLENDKTKLQNNWNELKKWLKQIQDFHIEQRGLVDNEFNYSLESEDIDVLEDVLHKMQELEQGKDDNRLCMEKI